MRRELLSQNLQLTPDCANQVEQMVRFGVQRMKINNAINHAGHVIQAERNLKHLIRHFCDYSRDVGTFPTLSAANFQRALTNCPTLWPYRSST